MLAYQNIAKSVALRAGQIVGGDAAAREAAYIAADISAQMDGVEVPYSALRQDILDAESELAAAIGRDVNSVYRSAIIGVSANLVDGDEVPATDEAGAAFVGMFDGVFDSSNNRVLKKQPSEVVRRRVDNPGGFWVRDAYHYAITGTIIEHTRQSVYFRGCSWDRPTQESLYDLQSVSPLPQEFAVLWSDLVCMGLEQEGWFQNEASFFAAKARGRWQQFFPGQPMPPASTRANPVKD